MNLLRKLTFLFLLGGLALPVFLNAEEVNPETTPKDGWKTKPIASFLGNSVTAEQLARFMCAMGYVDARERLIKQTLIVQEAAARGVVIAAPEIDKALLEYTEELIRQGDVKDIADLYRVNRMSPADVRESVRIRLALKKMVLQEMNVDDELLSSAITVWLSKVEKKAKIVRFAIADGQPLENAATVNGENIAIDALIKEILKRYSDDELEDFIQEVADFKLVETYLIEQGTPLTTEDLHDEYKILEHEIHEDPSFNGVELEDILAAKKKTIKELFAEPGFRLRAMIRKACDKKTAPTAEELKAFFNEHYLDFCDRMVKIRLISIYHRKFDGKQVYEEDPEGNKIPVTSDDAHKKAVAVRKEIDEGLAFEEAAMKYAQDPQLRPNGGLLTAPLYRDDNIFKYFPELTVIFKAKLGEVIGPIKTAFGSHIVKIESITDKTFEEVQGDVLREYRINLRKEWLDGIRKAKNASHIGSLGVLKIFCPDVNWEEPKKVEQTENK